MKKSKSTFDWYRALKKPSWAPPPWLFGPVWTVLYILIFISFGSVIVRAWQGYIPLAMALPFILNLACNAAFTPLQFGLKNNSLAAIDIVLVLVTLIWAMIAVHPIVSWVAYMQIPYLLWVGFATILQLTVTYLNR